MIIQDNHTEIFSFVLQGHWNHTEKFFKITLKILISALLISFVPRFFSVTLDFQCDFQCHNFIVCACVETSLSWQVSFNFKTTCIINLYHHGIFDWFLVTPATIMVEKPNSLWYMPEEWYTPEENLNYDNRVLGFSVKTYAWFLIILFTRVFTSYSVSLWSIY